MGGGQRKSVLPYWGDHRLSDCSNVKHFKGFPKFSEANTRHYVLSLFINCKMFMDLKTGAF